jgi:hypothetical protein
MKTARKIISLSLFSGLFCLAVTQSDAQVIVKVRPARPVAVITRPAPPSPRHVWIEEEWVPQGNTYVWHGGYWVAPPRPGAVYIKGHWRQSRRGWIWIPGHWR